MTDMTDEQAVARVLAEKRRCLPGECVIGERCECLMDARAAIACIRARDRERAGEAVERTLDAARIWEADEYAAKVLIDLLHENADLIASLLAQLREKERECERLFAAIAHGDEEHRAWLKQAIADHFAGRTVEQPRGKGKTELRADTAEARLAQARELRWADDAAGIRALYEHGDVINIGVNEGDWYAFLAALKETP